LAALLFSNWEKTGSTLPIVVFLTDVFFIVLPDPTLLVSLPVDREETIHFTDLVLSIALSLYTERGSGREVGFKSICNFYL